MTTCTVLHRTFPLYPTMETQECWVISYPVLGNTYYFNYAYDTEEQAITVCNTINEHRATGNYDAKGHKIDTLTDLAFNFVLASKVAFLQKRTNQKRNWYLAR